MALNDLASFQANRVIDANVTFAYGADAVRADPLLGKIYGNAKAQQWDAAVDLDWSHTLDSDNPLRLPDGTVVIFGTDMWRAMSDAQRADVRKHIQSWQLSQILHSEHASLMCAAKIAQAEPDLAVKYCVALQVADEARHIEAYARLLRDKLPYTYPISASLDRLLTQIIGAPEYDLAALGMQILVEGMALAFFRGIQAYSGDPFIKKLQGLVLRDEARHFAIGRIVLCRIYRELSAAELARREGFLAEACHLLHEHLCADEIWEPIGLPRKQCAELVRASAVTASLQRTLFRQIVPAVRDIGLLGPRVRKFFESIDALDYAEFPVK